MKFFGLVGFWSGDVEVSPGVFRPLLTERPYFGDVNWNNRHFQGSENQNEEIRLNNQISILSDLYSHEHFASIRYVIWNGVKWRVTNVEVNYPRIVLTIGGVYNGSGTKEVKST